MVVLMGFNAFGTRLQSLWIMFFARKDFPCGVRNRMQDKILFRQLRFSLFSSARYFDMSPQVFVRGILALILGSWFRKDLHNSDTG